MICDLAGGSNTDCPEDIGTPSVTCNFNTDRCAYQTTVQKGTTKWHRYTSPYNGVYDKTDSYSGMI